MKEQILDHSGSPNVFWADLGLAFISSAWNATVKALKALGISAKMRSFYSTQFKSCTERMMQILRLVIARKLGESGTERNILLPNVVNSHRVWPASDGASTYELKLNVAQKNPLGLHQPKFSGV